MKAQIQHIPNINTFEGMIPSGFDLVEYVSGTDPVEEGMVLYGFDEIGMFGLPNVKHAFVKFMIEFKC